MHFVNKYEPRCEKICLGNGVRLNPSGLLIETTVMILSFGTDRFGQTVQTQIRLLLDDQGIHCLRLHLHHFDKIP